MENKQIDQDAELLLRYEELQANPDSNKFLVFCTAITKTPLLVPRHVNGKGLSILHTQHKDSFIPAFTSQQELSAWAFPRGEVVPYAFPALNHMVVDELRLSGIVINPFGKMIFLPRKQLQEIMNATTNMTVNHVVHEGKVILEKAKNVPSQLPAALIRGLARKPEVYEAYILSAREETDSAPHMLFLIDFDGDRKLLFPYVVEIIKPHMKKGATFELAKATYFTLHAAREKVEPVYTARKAVEQQE